MGQSGINTSIYCTIVEGLFRVIHSTIISTQFLDMVFLMSMAQSYIHRYIYHIQKHGDKTIDIGKGSSISCSRLSIPANI